MREEAVSALPSPMLCVYEGRSLGSWTELWARVWLPSRGVLAAPTLLCVVLHSRTWKSARWPVEWPWVTGLPWGKAASPGDLRLHGENGQNHAYFAKPCVDQSSVSESATETRTATPHSTSLLKFLQHSQVEHVTHCQADQEALERMRLQQGTYDETGIVGNSGVHKV